MKKIINWLFADFLIALYHLAEAKFVLHTISYPNPKLLRYFDNANATPAPQGVTSGNFNNEPSDVWLGFDSATLQLCIANYNRTIVICCFQGA